MSESVAVFWSSLKRLNEVFFFIEKNRHVACGIYKDIKKERDKMGVYVNCDSNCKKCSYGFFQIAKVRHSDRLVFDRDVIKAMKNVSLALEKLVDDNMGLIKKEASSIWRKYKHLEFSGMEFEDLLQQAKMGFIEGVDRYEPEKGALSTVCVFWIRHKVRRYIQNNISMIRLPVNIKRNMEVVGFENDTLNMSMEEASALMLLGQPEIRAILDEMIEGKEL